MKKFIVKDWDHFFSIDDIVIDETTFQDDRIGWNDTRYICTKRFGNNDNIALYGCPQCIGFCAYDYPQKM